MAVATVFKDGYVYWTTATGGSYAEAPDVKEVQVPLSKAELENSVMSDGAATFFPGILSAPITIRARQSFASGGMDSSAWTKFNSESRIKLKLRAVDSAVSSTNPSYIFNPVSVFSITPISGAHGALLEQNIQLRLLSGGTVTRSTAT